MSATNQHPAAQTINNGHRLGEAPIPVAVEAHGHDDDHTSPAPRSAAGMSHHLAKLNDDSTTNSDSPTTDDPQTEQRGSDGDPARLMPKAYATSGSVRSSALTTGMSATNHHREEQTLNNGHRPGEERRRIASEASGQEDDHAIPVQVRAVGVSERLAELRQELNSILAGGSEEDLSEFVGIRDDRRTRLAPVETTVTENQK